MGELYALICALMWGAAVILFKRSGETVPPFALNLFRVVVSSLLLVATVLLVEGALWHQATREDILRLFVSGLLSIALADTFFHRCLNAVGAGITAIVDCLYAPLMGVFAFLMLGEVLDVSSSIGLVMVVSAVLLSTRLTPPRRGDPRPNRARHLLGSGRHDLPHHRRRHRQARPRQPLRALGHHRAAGRRPGDHGAAGGDLVSTQGMVPRLPARPKLAFHLDRHRHGSYLALLFWLAGMKHTQTGVAAILNQTSSIYVLILAAIFLGERFTRRKAAAAALAFGGILMVWAF